MINKEHLIFDKPISIIPSKLYFICSDDPVKTYDNAYEFNIDEVMLYLPFCQDFGPLSIASLYNFIKSLNSLLLDKKNEKNVYYHRTSRDYKKYVNSVLLICAFQMVILGKTPQKAFEAFSQFVIPPYVDSSNAKWDYHCTILHCLRGLDYAMTLKWFSMDSFNLKKYYHYEKIKNGDISEIISNKMFAFSAPSNKNDSFLPVNGYHQIFKEIGIQVVIGLSQSSDFTTEFKNLGIKSHRVIFPEDTSPTLKVVEEFLRIVEQYDENVKIGVYCKSGLGKTGTMIGCYAIKHYKMKAEEYIGWARLCRPGSVQGSQQRFLLKIEQSLHSQGESSQIRQKINDKREKLKPKNFSSSLSKFSSEDSPSSLTKKRYTRVVSTKMIEEKALPEIESPLKKKKQRLLGLQRLKKMLD